MPHVSILPDHKEIESKPRETLLQASLRARVAHAHACGGNARCSTCRIFVQEGLDRCLPRNKMEIALAKQLHFTPEIRLACQTVISGDVEIRRLVLDNEDLELADQLRSGTTPAPVGEEMNVAVLFADIRGFTSFSENLPPYDVVHILNRYFHRVGQAITRNGGHIDNYIGDGLMALFGVEDPKDAPLRAVRAGLDMLRAVERLRPYLENITTRSFRIGIGVNYGGVVVGAIGHDESQRVTAIGDTVNFASRIEAANKNADTELLISETTYDQVRDKARVGKTVRVTIPGKSGEYNLYEIIGVD